MTGTGSRAGSHVAKLSHVIATEHAGLDRMEKVTVV
jgi:hypothetical protein